jgi:hypothetical protein
VVHKFLILWFVLTLSSLQASELKKSARYTIDGKVIDFIVDFKNHLTVNQSCWKSEKYQCAAFKALQKVSSKMLADQNLLDEQVGGIFCQKSGGQAVMGINKKKNQTPFCHYSSDNSYISFNSLIAHAVKK